jgi:hypothetical protein
MTKRPEWRKWGKADRPPPPQLFEPPPGEAISDERRTVILDWKINEYVAEGWRLESRSPTQAVMGRGEPVNHVLHAILTVFTCLLWGIVWMVIAAQNKRERVSLTVDQVGNVAVVNAPGR